MTENFIRLRSIGEDIAVDLLNIQALSKFSSFEVSLIFYPLNKAIKADSIAFQPFDEYVSDAQKTRSVYKSLADGADTLFGVILGVITIFVLLLVNKDDLASIRAIISAASAFALGKEIWKYIDNFLVDLTERWRISFRENVYAFQLKKPTTITKYSYLAKKMRYGIETILPEKVDLIRQSNSELIKMQFSKADLSYTKNSSAQVMIIDLDRNIDLKEYLIAVKITFNRDYLFFSSNLEYFEALNRGELGCLDQKDDWIKDCVLLKRNVSFGRIKFLYAIEQQNSNFLDIE